MVRAMLKQNNVAANPELEVLNVTHVFPDSLDIRTQDVKLVNIV